MREAHVARALAGAGINIGLIATSALADQLCGGLIATSRKSDQLWWWPKSGAQAPVHRTDWRRRSTTGR